MYGRSSFQKGSPYISYCSSGFFLRIKLSQNVIAPLCEHAAPVALHHLLLHYQNVPSRTWPQAHRTWSTELWICGISSFSITFFIRKFFCAHHLQSQRGLQKYWHGVSHCSFLMKSCRCMRPFFIPVKLLNLRCQCLIFLLPLGTVTKNKLICLRHSLIEHSKKHLLCTDCAFFVYISPVNKDPVTFASYDKAILIQLTTQEIHHCSHSRIGLHFTNSSSPVMW